MRKVLLVAFHVVAALSASLCAAALVEWARWVPSTPSLQNTLYRSDSIPGERIPQDARYELATTAEGLRLIGYSAFTFKQNAAYSAYANPEQWEQRVRATEFSKQFGGFRFERTAYSSSAYRDFQIPSMLEGYNYDYAIPYWSIAAVTSVFPLAWLWRVLLIRLQNRRTKAGCCPYCGYDLRASENRCPECGRPIEKAG